VKKGKRFFADAKNDTVGLFFVILRPKAEGSHILMCFKRKKTITGDSSLHSE
jgi:hypothetical protein